MCLPSVPKVRILCPPDHASYNSWPGSCVDPHESNRSLNEVDVRQQDGVVQHAETSSRSYSSDKSGFFDCNATMKCYINVFQAIMIHDR